MSKRFLVAEAPFHVLAIAIVTQAMLNGADLRDAVTNAGIISILGRVTPTEILDKLLSIPLDRKRDE